MNSQGPHFQSIGPQFCGLFENVDLVLFDFDGVIADSEVISLETLRQTFAAHGLDLPLSEVRERFLGTSLATILTHLQQHCAIKHADQFACEWQTLLFQQFRQTLQPVPGVLSWLDMLDAKDLPFCIASSGTMERIDIALGAMGLQGRFDHVFNAEQVDRGKPAPDLFLHAARQMNVTVQRCLVIEDSRFGIMAAKAAGMRSAGFVGGAHLSDISERHAEDLRNLGAEVILHEFSPIVAQP